MTETPAETAAFARTLRLLWGAVCAAGAVVLAVFGVVAAQGGAPLADHADLVFYGMALLSLAGIAGGFALLRAMEGRLLAAGSAAEAAQTVQTWGLLALATVDATAVLAGAAAVVSGDLLPLAFGAPLFAFAWLTWPSDDRVARWLALRQR